MSRIYFSPAAQQDMNDIWSFIAGDDPAAATAFTDLIETKCESLGQFPRLGLARDELRPGLRSIPVGDYLVFYRVAADEIEVVRVLSGYRDLEAEFEQ